MVEQADRQRCMHRIGAQAQMLDIHNSKPMLGVATTREGQVRQAQIDTNVASTAEETRIQTGAAREVQ